MSILIALLVMGFLHVPSATALLTIRKSPLHVLTRQSEARPFRIKLDDATWARWQEVPPLVETPVRFFFLQPTTPPAWNYIPFPLVSDTAAFNNYVIVNPGYTATLLLNTYLGGPANTQITFNGTAVDPDASVLDVEFVPTFDWGGPAVTTFLDAPI